MPVSEIVRRQHALACLRSRLLWLVGCLGLLLVVVTVWGLLAVNSANERQQEVLASATQMLQAVDEVRQAQVSFKKQVQEWKDVLLRGDDPADYARYWALFEADEKDTDTDLAQARALLDALQLPTEPLDQFKTSHAALGAAYRVAIKDYRGGDAATVFAVDDKVRGIDRAPTTQLDNYVLTLVGAAKVKFENLASNSQDRVDFDKKFREAMLLAVTLGIALAVVFTVRSLARVEEILEDGADEPPAG
jgi:hypothetical protein